MAESPHNFGVMPGLSGVGVQPNFSFDGCLDHRPAFLGQRDSRIDRMRVGVAPESEDASPCVDGEERAVASAKRGGKLIDDDIDDAIMVKAVKIRGDAEHGFGRRHRFIRVKPAVRWCARRTADRSLRLAAIWAWREHLGQALLPIRLG
ncbi:MAG: hypothetical protein JXA69_19485 [Phycisphaerae bacterium]|nr:hypothetical protein [Phycisphaerae bacterium]